MLKTCTHTLISILILFNTCFAQTGTVQGFIYDNATNETLVGVNIIADENTGVISYGNGFYALTLPAGTYTFTYSFIGYQSDKETFEITDGGLIEKNIYLKPDARQLDIVVISGSLYEKQLTEETVSMEVLKTSLIENTNAVSLSDAITKAPGVFMLDEQINIRGGTGFTYGAGSRVMLVVDDQVLLAPDRGDAKWNFVPMENVEQIEVIKGASSVLYGSSALNGVISVRTAWPGSEPYTMISAYQGITSKPKDAYKAWWDEPILQTGINFAHRQKFEKLDLVLGGHASKNESALEGAMSDRLRFNWKTRFRTKNPERLSYGLNGNLMYDNEGTFFLFMDGDSGIYQPFGGGYDQPTSTTLLNWKYFWTTIDPWLNFNDSDGNQHQFKMRYYKNNVTYTDSTGGDAYLINLDYQYHREFAHNFYVTAGFSGYTFHVKDDGLGDHDGFSGGFYGQVEKKLFDRLTLNFGFREEWYLLDTAEALSAPIVKAGINYRAGPATFLRASFGQGYRAPSLVEKYSRTNLGVLQIFDNPDIKPEYGWNAEVGVKKSLFIQNWSGYADAAFYVTDYFDMTEFTFGAYYYYGSYLPGFKSLNIGRSRMAGFELTLAGNGEVFGNNLSIIGGYNYVYPANLNTDSALYQWNTFFDNFIHGFNHNDSAFVSTVLNYRFRHMYRTDLEYTIKKIGIGFTVNYYSYMENIDYVFVDYGIPPGLQDFRFEHLNGDWIFDARVGYNINTHMRLQCMVKNIFNHEYALRPAKTDQPANYTLLFKYIF